MLQTQAAISKRVIGALEWWSDGKRLRAASQYSTTPWLHRSMSPRLRQLFVLAAAHFKRRALDDFRDESRKFVMVPAQPLCDLVHGAFVVILQTSAQRVGQHLFRHTMHEVV